MSDLTPFRKNNLSKRDDFFSPFIQNFLNDDFFSAMQTMQGSFKVDLKETEDQYLVEADLPGIPKEAISVDYDHNQLIIQAKRDETLEDKRENYVRRERHYGQLSRSFYVYNVDESKIDATFKDGVLKIILPKKTKGHIQKKSINIH
jgi:HSP20 family protein